MEIFNNGTEEVIVAPFREYNWGQDIFTMLVFLAMIMFLVFFHLITSSEYYSEKFCTACFTEDEQDDLDDRFYRWEEAMTARWEQIGAFFGRRTRAQGYEEIV